MKRKLLTVGLFAVLLALPAIVQAANITNFFDYSGKLNQIKYQNYSAFVDIGRESHRSRSGQFSREYLPCGYTTSRKGIGRG